MNAPTIPQKLPPWLRDVALVLIGAGLTILGTVQGGRFGDGMVTGFGIGAMSFGIRGLMAGD